MPEEPMEAELDSTAGGTPTGPPPSAASDAGGMQEQIELSASDERAIAADISSPSIENAAAPSETPSETPSENGAGSHGLASAGASLLPPAAAADREAIMSAVARLRAEVTATTDKPRKARLLNEAGEIQERGGEESGAARDYLAAYNADTSFREPLEGLVRLLERRRSLSNLGKLIEALVTAASTPEERARALTQRAIFFEDVQKDLEGSRGAAREATETGAGPADIGPALLALELVSAKLGDGEERQEALVGRAEATLDPTWRGLLLIDAAELAAAAGEIERALGLLARTRSEGGQAAWAATKAAERVVRAEPGLPGGDEARDRSRVLAETLEARAAMIEAAIASSAEGDAQGVPHHVRSLENIVDLLIRAANARRLGSEIGRGAQALDHALEILQDARGGEGEDGEAIATMERLVLSARIRLAEGIGDTALAADLAERRMLGEMDGGLAASLAMRVAEHAASEGDVERALGALTKATERDPLCAPARALKIDILEAGDAARFATELEELSRHCTTPEAQGRALLLAAYVWAARGASSERAGEALAKAETCGIAKDVVARFGRSLASVRGDDRWYEEATRTLIECTPIASEQPFLWVEIARLRLAQNDEAGATKATEALRALEEGAWLGRILDGLASPEIEPPRARTALEELAAEASEPSLARSLRLVCVLRAHAAGDPTKAIEHLEALARDDAGDPLVAAYLGDLLRRAGDRAAAAQLSSSSAEAAESDPERAAARHLEAGLERWRLGDRAAAMTSLESAVIGAPEAASPVLAWALRGVDVDGIDGRRRALDAAGGDAGVSLERFALEASGGDPDEAESALAAVDIASSSNLRLAGALARLAWPKGGDDRDALTGALETLTSIGSEGKTAAAAERLRFTRDDGGDVVAAARGWLDAGGGAAAGVEWLAATMASGDAATEIPARRALAEILSDEAREALHASATLLATVLSDTPAAKRLEPDHAPALVVGSSLAARLANLELAPPGCEPRRRASALSELDGALGEPADIDALALGAWSALAAGDPTAALDVFRAVTATRPDELQAWEGMRVAAEELRDNQAYAVACEQLGERCANAARGAAFWEQAALAWLRLAEQPGSEEAGSFDERAEAALDASFARDAARAVAFDKLFRRVRERKEHDKLLAIVTRRLEVIEDPAEIAKMYWEMARVLREKGDPDGALEALEHVTMFDENHVGALALTGEILIRRGKFAEAAENLARLACVSAAPPKNRITAGVAAVDLYENKLARHDLALEVLLTLHDARLTTLPVRERLARAAARTGSWDKATKVLEELMLERPERTGRIEAARLAMAIYRDRLSAPASALPSVTKLLDEAPSDGEALDLVIALDPKVAQRKPLLERGRDSLLLALHETPQNLETQRRLARISHHLGDGTLEQAALSCTIALGGPDGGSEQMIALLSGKKPRAPQIGLNEAMIRQILAPGDDGPIADLFVALASTLAEALGPTREALGVTKKDRIDPRAGIALRHEIAQWAGAFGIQSFDLYVGGRDPGGVHGIAGDTPAIVVGSGVNAPLSPTTRARVARELLSIVRGTTVTRWRDDTTIAAITVAACNIVKVKVDAPPFAVLAEVERHMAKAIARKTKSVIEPICRAFVQSGQDARQWAARARSSQGRSAALAAGDVSVVLADVFGEPVERLGALARDDLRAHELLRFVLSRPYFDLRRALGLEG